MSNGTEATREKNTSPLNGACQILFNGFLIRLVWIHYFPVKPASRLSDKRARQVGPRGKHVASPPASNHGKAQMIRMTGKTEPLLSIF